MKRIESKCTTSIRFKSYNKKFKLDSSKYTTLNLYLEKLRAVAQSGNKFHN